MTQVDNPQHVDRRYRDELTERTQRMLCATALLFGWTWLIVGATLLTQPLSPSRLRALVPAIVIIASSLVGLSPVTRARSLTRILFIGGLSAIFPICILWFTSSLWLYYPMLIVFIASLLLGWKGSTVVGVVLSGTLMLLYANAMVPYATDQVWPPFALIGSAILISAISSHNLYTAVGWAFSTQKRANQLLHDLRLHQGRLNRTLEALTEANRRLDRTNRELGFARREAEEGRSLKGHFVANVSHELRTPLNLIVGFSEILYLEPDGYEGVVWTPDLTSDIGQMYRASRHLQSLVNDILDLSRIDVARLPMFREMLDLRPIITEAIDTISPLLKERKLYCRAVFPEALSQLFVDRTRIRQVMLNLLNNAIRFTDEGGITISIQQTPDTVLVHVSDTGLGVPEDKIELIFEEFRSVDTSPSRRGGAGLGLALSRQFIELHGGNMWAESRQGEGSAFHFAIPLPGAIPRPGRLIRVPDRVRDSSAHASIIMVDPDSTIASMLGRYLGDRRLLPVSNIAEAERLIEAEHPAGVIVNLAPGACDQNWVGEIGALGKRYSVPIVRCSIPSASWLRSEKGLDDCLTKPISREVLVGAVSRTMPRPGKVLVIDDHPGFGSLVTRFLQGLPMVEEVLTAYTGDEALSLAREATPDLVILGLMLPDIDGFALLHSLRDLETLRHMPIIGITATSYAEEALQRHSGLFTLTRAAGLSTGSLAELLNAVFQIVRADYLAEDSTS